MVLIQENMLRDHMSIVLGVKINFIFKGLTMELGQNALLVGLIQKVSQVNK
jgi:hypothetical protein